MREDLQGLPERGPFPRGPLRGLGALVLLLCALTALGGTSARGWVVGLACGMVGLILITRSMIGHGRNLLGPADRVTLIRGVLACGVAALAAEVGAGSAAPIGLLVGLSAVAILLDGVDGWVARRTGTTSAFGARFDMEVDAFLILVLSLHVARAAGWWVVLLGLARYLYLAAGLLLPWLSASPPPRRWAKVVAVGVALLLVVAGSGLLAPGVTEVALAVGLVLLAESFAHSTLALWQMRGGRTLTRSGPAAALALLLVWLALLLPDRLDSLSVWTPLSIPLEGVAFVALVLVLPRRAVGRLALTAGLVLAAVTLLRILDIGFRVAFDVPFHLVYDGGNAAPAFRLLAHSIGTVGAWAATLVVVGLALGVLIGLPWALHRVTRVANQNRRPAMGVLCAMIGVAVVLAATAPFPRGGPGVSTATIGAAVNEVTEVRQDLRHEREFIEAAGREDVFAQAPQGTLLSALRGKDVLLLFVESYGRSAFGFDAVRSAVEGGQARLTAAGLSARSGWLSSSTLGGRSWLAHSTLQSGLWVDNPRDHQRLMGTERLTLSGVFARAGWHTVMVAPAVSGQWPEATRFYRYGRVIDQRNLGYAGPAFGWAAMPDQYTLAAFRRMVLDAPHAGPVMAEIQLVSSHWPWVPLPRMVDWTALGNGSIFADMAAQGTTPASAVRDPDEVRASYADAIAYSLTAVTAFLAHLGDPNLVVLMLGDHQPSSLVSGAGSSREVPISVIAGDPGVIRRARSWGWSSGLQPEAGAPTWPMDAFRDRFLTAFSG